MNDRCPTCNASLKQFWHTLTPGLVSILVKAIEFVHACNRNEFHLQNDLHLTVNEFCNLTKLRFHGLVAKVKGKPGYWLITSRGGQFLRGEIRVPLKVLTFRNHVQEHSEELIHIDELKGRIPVFEKEFAYEVQPIPQRVAKPSDSKVEHSQHPLV
jgi:hypothetical protein